MLWYKSWLETRWRFLIGLALLMLVGLRPSCSTYPAVMRLLPLASAIDGGGEIGRRIREGRRAGARLPRLRLVAVVQCRT